MSRVSTRTLALASSVAALSMTLSACSLLGGNTSAFNVEVGQCVQLPNGSTISRVEVVECTAEHDGEVYHIEKRLFAFEGVGVVGGVGRVVAG